VSIDLLRGVGLVVHEQEVELVEVVDEESLMSGRHHVPRLPVAAISDLYQFLSALPFFTHLPSLSCSLHGLDLPMPAEYPLLHSLRLPSTTGIVQRTFGITAWPLKRLLTRLSIPFGFLQLGSTRIKRSDWWRLKRAVCFFTIVMCFFAAIFARCQYETYPAARICDALCRTVTVVWC